MQNQSFNATEVMIEIDTQLRASQKMIEYAKSQIEQNEILQARANLTSVMRIIEKLNFHSNISSSQQSQQLNKLSKEVNQQLQNLKQKYSGSPKKQLV